MSIKKWAAGLAIAASPFTVAADTQAAPPSTPASVRKGEAQRIGELMTHMYDIYEVPKMLGITQMRAVDSSDKAGQQDITDEKARDEIGRSFGVDLNALAKVHIDTTASGSRYEFWDKNDKLIATGTSVRMEDKEKSDYIHRGIFRATQIGEGEQKMIYQYHEDKASKWNRVEIAFHAEGRGDFKGPSFRMYHTGYLNSWGEELGQQSLRLIEELAKKQQEKQASDRPR